MPTFTTLNCPVCSAPLKPNMERCDYCYSYVYIQSDMPKIDPTSLNRATIDEQIAKFRTALRYDPNDGTAHYGLGIAYYNLGLIRQALEELEEAARVMPENPHIRLQLMRIYRDRDEDQEAWKHCRELLLLDPASKEAQSFQAVRDFYATLPDHNGGGWDKLYQFDPELANTHKAWFVDQLVRSATAHTQSYNGRHTNVLLEDSRLAAIRLWNEILSLEPEAVREPLAKFLSKKQQILITADQFMNHPLRRVQDMQEKAKELTGGLRINESRSTHSYSLFYLPLIAFVLFVIAYPMLSINLRRQLYEIQRPIVGKIAETNTPIQGVANQWLSTEMVTGRVGAVWLGTPMLLLALVVAGMLLRLPGAIRDMKHHRLQQETYRLHQEASILRKSANSGQELAQFLNGSVDPARLVKAGQYVLDKIGNKPITSSRF